VDQTRGPARRYFRLGSVAGVPIYLAPSWLLIAVFITVSFRTVFRHSVDGLSESAAYLLGFGYAVLLAGSVLAHEIGHTVIALALRLRVRSIVIFLLGGATEIDPEPERPRHELLVSGAGPAVSAGLAGGAWLWRDHVADGSVLAVELDLLIWGNLAVAVFNALPGLPLDGGRVLRALIAGTGVSRLSATKVAAVIGYVVAVLVAVSGFVMGRGTWTIATVAIMAMLGAFLWFGATQALLAARVAERLPRLSAARLARPALFVQPAVSVAEAFRRASEAGAEAIVVVDPDDRPQGIVAAERVAAVPPERRAWTAVADVAETTDVAGALAGHLRGQDLVDACSVRPAGRYLVTDADGRAYGVLTAADIRAELESRSGRAAMPRRDTAEGESW
jgi:Zn-dependent protease/CBS domain-containing protein